MTPHWTTPACLPASQRAHGAAGTRDERRRMHQIGIMTPAGIYSCRVPVEPRWVSALRQLVRAPQSVESRLQQAAPSETQARPVASAARVAIARERADQAFMRNYQSDPVVILAAGLVVGAMLFLSRDLWQGYEQIKLHGAVQSIDAPAGARVRATVVMEKREGVGVLALPRASQR